jgi:predicted methyltransferase
MALAGCESLHEVMAPEPMMMAEDYAGVLADPNRPAADAEDDAARRPAEVMAFAGIAEGDTVFELEAGGGWYTELFSRAVGPDGEVVLQYPEEFDGFYAEALETRLADDRLPNVRVSKTPFDDLDAPDASADVVTWILGPHELWFRPDNAPDGMGDPAGSFEEAYRILKDDGVFLVIDHAAPSGAPAETGGTTHRIDPAIILGLAEDAGFELDAESDILANPDDNLEVMVFDPSVRRQTDRFLFRFTKGM